MRDVGSNYSPLILVVEDERLLSMEMEYWLDDLGYRVLGPAASIERATALVENETPDAAILDVNLNGRWVTPIVEDLRAKEVPCLLTTAYRPEDLTHAALCDLPVLQKPLRESEVGSALAHLLT